MNKQQIDALEGRELDLAIERYVFGREKPNYERTDWLQRYSDGTWYGERQVCIDGEWIREFESVEWPPRYHNSVFLAFQVVDYVRYELLWGFVLESSVDGSWVVSFDKGYNFISCIDISRATAICRAALKVVCDGS